MMAQELCANCAEGMTLTKLGCDLWGWELSFKKGRVCVAGKKNDHIRSFREWPSEGGRIPIADRDIEA